MKHLTYLFTFFIITSFFTMASASGIKANSTDLVIHLQGFENSKGVAKVAVCNSQKNFKDSTPFKGFDFKIINNKAERKITLPYGEYAIKVYHDENNNNELDTMMFGIPTEDYGFSNDARGSVGPPEYKDALLILNSPKQKITINVK
ncbi:DUF2141 domain-containing protein [Desulfobacula sp.]|uniref:DUF2141 domain-containing protein n=1 Tax=Candidatus Desulfatibia vada TaxID=2841696 RepID=A0A8J6P3L8_9BACT|nr:DUF2141 domain-containing protein [Candidatus Desulfatibia vada]MBL6996626.1 DUF2141 domain-containing protein [Desulfobacula sp.]